MDVLGGCDTKATTIFIYSTRIAAVTHNIPLSAWIRCDSHKNPSCVSVHPGKYESRACFVVSYSHILSGLQKTLGNLEHMWWDVSNPAYISRSDRWHTDAGSWLHSWLLVLSSPRPPQVYLSSWKLCLRSFHPSLSRHHYCRSHVGPEMLKIKNDCLQCEVARLSQLWPLREYQALAILFWTLNLENSFPCSHHIFVWARGISTWWESLIKWWLYLHINTCLKK